MTFQHISLDAGETQVNLQGDTVSWEPSSRSREWIIHSLLERRSQLVDRLKLLDTALDRVLAQMPQPARWCPRCATGKVSTDPYEPCPYCGDKTVERPDAFPERA